MKNKKNNPIVIFNELANKYYDVTKKGTIGKVLAYHTDVDKSVYILVEVLHFATHSNKYNFRTGEKFWVLKETVNEHIPTLEILFGDKV